MQMAVIRHFEDGWDYLWDSDYGYTHSVHQIDDMLAVSTRLRLW